MQKILLILPTAMKLKEFKEWMQSCRILTDGAVGLNPLHKRGLVHRNIIPENVLLITIDDEILGHAEL